MHEGFDDLELDAQQIQELRRIAAGRHTEDEHTEFVDTDGKWASRCDICFARAALIAAGVDEA